MHTRSQQVEGREEVIFLINSTPIMSPAKLSVSKNSTAIANKLSKTTGSVSKTSKKTVKPANQTDVSDAYEEPEQVIAVIAWDESDHEDATPQNDQSDDAEEEPIAHSGRQPTEYDSASEDEDADQPPTPIVQPTKLSTKAPVKSEKQQKTTIKPRITDKSTPGNTTEAAKNRVKKEDASSSSDRRINKRNTIKEEPASISLMGDETSEKRAENPVKRLKSTTASASPRRTTPKKQSKKRSGPPVLSDMIDKETFNAYREAIAPFFKSIGTEEDGDLVTPADRFAVSDAFYESVNELASKMQGEDDDYSSRNISIKKDGKNGYVLQYINGDINVQADSPINGHDVLKFFRMTPMKRELDRDDVLTFLTGPYINTVNVLSIDTKKLGVMDYDRMTLFSHFNDAPYAKSTTVTFNVPKYVELISKLNKWSVSKVFEARSNWLCLIDTADKEQMWMDAAKAINEFTNEDPTNSIRAAVIDVWKTLINSNYVKQYIMYHATPNPLFAKIFKHFLETDTYLDTFKELFMGPLEPIASCFTPYHYKYNSVEYDPADDNSSDVIALIKHVEDIAMYDPRNGSWIGKLIG